MFTLRTESVQYITGGINNTRVKNTDYQIAQKPQGIKRSSLGETIATINSYSDYSIDNNTNFHWHD